MKRLLKSDPLGGHAKLLESFMPVELYYVLKEKKQDDRVMKDA